MSVVYFDDIYNLNEIKCHNAMCTVMLKYNISEGTSTTNSLNYYARLIDILKDYVENIYITLKCIAEYAKHIPIITYINLRLDGYDDGHNGRKYKHIYLTIFDFGYEKYINDTRISSKKKIGIDFNNQIIDIKNINFINDLLKVRYINNESIMYLFAKYSRLDFHFPKLCINKVYSIPGQHIEFYFALNKKEAIFNEIYVLNYNSPTLNIVDGVITDKKFSYPCGKDNIYDNPNYVKNLYFTINFSQTATFYDKGLEFIHPILREMIRVNFPSFYDAKYNSKFIEMGGGQLKIIYCNDILIEQNPNKIKILIPPELNNSFINVKSFKFELLSYKKNKEIYNEIVITICK